MNFPCIIISTIDCDCDMIKYKVVICYDIDNNQEALIDSVSLLPFLGRSFELLNAHRVEEDKKKKESNERSDIPEYQQ